MSSPAKLRPLGKRSYLTPLPNSPSFADVRLSKQLSVRIFQLQALTNPASRTGTARPNPAHLEQRSHPLCGRTDQQTDLQQARGQHVLHGTAGQDGSFPAGSDSFPQDSGAFPPSAPPRPSPRRGAERPCPTREPSPPVTALLTLIGYLSCHSKSCDQSERQHVWRDGRGRGFAVRAGDWDLR